MRYTCDNALPSRDFLYVVFDSISGWLKVGISSAPYARLYQLRRDYPELRNALLVGAVGTSTAYSMIVELHVHEWLGHHVEDYSDKGCKMAGERYLLVQLCAQEVLAEVLSIAWLVDPDAFGWSDAAPRRAA